MPARRHLLLPSGTARALRRGKSSTRTRRHHHAPGPHAAEPRRPSSSRRTPTHQPSQRRPPRASP
eukprot:9086854-Alexandrium_andersonii.AAC.1